MLDLNSFERKWLAKAVPKAEYKQLLTLPAEVVRDLYPDVFDFGPRGKRIKKVVSYFGEHMDALESFEKMMLGSMGQYTPLLTMNKEPETFYLERVLDNIRNLVDAQTSVTKYNDRATLFGIGCALLGDGVFPEDSMAEVQRYQLAPIVLLRYEQETR